jgi:phytoene/squalene synthetase
MKLYQEVAYNTGKLITKRYSTSFSIGTRLLGKNIRQAIYSIYGYVRVADEIVDSFHTHDQATLLQHFIRDTEWALQNGISTNPVIQGFQDVVHRYGIEKEYIDAFLASMEMDLNPQSYDRTKFEAYIYGSAEVVGLMCLRVFCEGDDALFHKLLASARALGAAFQKVNFLRDMQDDYHRLGRIYFPKADFSNFDTCTKREIEAEIEADFRLALSGIRQLPTSSRLGVYVAYKYYRALFEKIRTKEPKQLLRGRVRIPNSEKMLYLASGYVRYQMNWL